MEENLTPSEGSKFDAIPLSWRYECSSLAQAEAVQLKETVRELEASLAQTTSRLNSVCVELESANFALAEEKEKSVFILISFVFLQPNLYLHNISICGCKASDTSWYQGKVELLHLPD